MKYLNSMVLFICCQVSASQFDFNGHSHSLSVVNESRGEDGPSYSVYIDQKRVIDYTQTKNIKINALSNNVIAISEKINSKNQVYYFLDAASFDIIKQVYLSGAASDTEQNKIYIEKENKKFSINVSSIVDMDSAIYYFYMDKNTPRNLYKKLYVSALNSGYLSLIDFYGRGIGYDQCGKSLLLYGCDLGKKHVMLCANNEKYDYVLFSGKKEIQLSTKYESIPDIYYFHNGSYLYQFYFKDQKAFVDVKNNSKLIFSKQCLLPEIDMH